MTGITATKKRTKQPIMRTGTGTTGANTLTVSSTVSILFDGKPNTGDSFQLRCEDGPYDSTLLASDVAPFPLLNEERIDPRVTSLGHLDFNNVSQSCAYHLVHHRATTTETLGTSVPFEVLRGGYYRCYYPPSYPDGYVHGNADIGNTEETLRETYTKDPDLAAAVPDLTRVRANEP